jgi:hypothetical protein
MDASFIHEDLATPNPADIAAIQSLYPLSDSPTSMVTGTVTDSTVSGSRCQPNTVDYAALIGTDDPVANPTSTTTTTASSGGGCSLVME